MKRSEEANIVGEIGSLFLQLEQEIEKLKLENNVMKNRVKSVSSDAEENKVKLVKQVS